MFKSIIFYNHFGAGDIFESREFIKEYMEKIPAENFYYAHGKPLRILRDISKLQFIEVTEIMNPMRAVTVLDDALLINTWIGRDGRYVLPGIGCVVEKLYEMHNEILFNLNLKPLREDIFSYVPSIDYSYYNIESVDKFITEHSYQQKVLISNGNVHSMQAVNFDFTPVIKRLAKALPKILFILTEEANIIEDNVFFTQDIIYPQNGFDLNEISYLSLYCNVHIGRNSGPHVFTQVKENWLDSRKTSLSFTKVEEASHFIHNLPTQMEKCWSKSNSEEEIYNAMFKIMRRVR